MMLVYYAYFIPLFTAAVLLIFFRHKIQWWEHLPTVAATTVFILIAKWLCVESLIADTEYLGGYVTEVQYFEDWNERVHCRHPRYCTSCSGFGKRRSCRTYICGYHHAYDVDYHPEHWVAETTLGGRTITKQTYDKLLKKFNVSPTFKDLHRNYHTDDGDMYFGRYQGEDERLEPVADTETYENRPQASHGIYRYDHPDSAELKQYKPFDYPKLVGWHQDVLLGHNDPVAHQKLQAFNAKYGHQKQVRVFFLVFKNQPREAGFVQQRYWQNGNMNELVICVGVNDANDVQWSNVFTWCENQFVKVNIKNHIEASGTLNLSGYMDYIKDEVLKDWKRKDFHDFDYINIEPTPGQTWFIFITVILINIGIGYWAVTNEFENDEYYMHDSKKNKKKKKKKFELRW